MPENNDVNNSYQINNKESFFQSGCFILVVVGIILFFLLLIIAGATFFVIANKEDILKKIDEKFDSKIQAVNSNYNSNVNLGIEIPVAQDEIIIDGVKFKLIKVRALGDKLLAAASKYPSVSKNIAAEKGKQFIMVTLEIENTTTQYLPGYSVGDLKLVDENNQYEIMQSTDSGAWIPEGEEYYYINDFSYATKKIVSLIYEIPKDGVGWRMNVWGLDYLSRDEEGYLLIGL